MPRRRRPGRLAAGRTGKLSDETRLRDAICTLAGSLHGRGVTHGATGNISARLPDGGLIVTPTGTSFGRLDPARLARLDASGRLVSGDPPTKEMALHAAFYDTRASAGAVVHLHSAHAVALSTLPGTDPEDFLPALTPYAIMQLGRVRLLPYFRPGDAAMGDAVRGLGGRRAAVMLASHGPVVAGRSLEAAGDAIEELEATARLALLTRGLSPRLLTDAQVRDLVTVHGIEWDA